MKVTERPTIAVAELAALLSAQVCGDDSLLIGGAQALERACSGDISFLADSAFLHHLKTTQATAIFVSRDLSDSALALVPLSTLLIVEDAKQSFIEVLKRLSTVHAYGDVGISQYAFVHPSAKIGERSNIHPGARISENVVIGEYCNVHTGVCVGPGSHIGDHTTLHPNVVLYPSVKIGERVIIHAGSVIGADGFSYQTTAGRHEKIPHFGTVHIEDDVEIGANTTIDRAFAGVTLIGHGTKIDNLVQVAHNCELGPHNLLAGQVGLAGSVTTGEYVMFGGQAGAAPHVHLGNKASFAAQTGVTTSVKGDVTYSGTPAQSHLANQKQVIALRKLPQLRERMRELAAQIQALESQLQIHSNLLNRKS